MPMVFQWCWNRQKVRPGISSSGPQERSPLCNQSSIQPHSDNLDSGWLGSFSQKCWRCHKYWGKTRRDHKWVWFSRSQPFARYTSSTIIPGLREKFPGVFAQSHWKQTLAKNMPTFFGYVCKSWRDIWVSNMWLRSLFYSNCFLQSGQISPCIVGFSCFVSGYCWSLCRGVAELIALNFSKMADNVKIAILNSAWSGGRPASQTRRNSVWPFKAARCNGVAPFLSLYSLGKHLD